MESFRFVDFGVSGILLAGGVYLCCCIFSGSSSTGVNICFCGNESGGDGVINCSVSILSFLKIFIILGDFNEICGDRVGRDISSSSSSIMIGSSFCSPLCSILVNCCNNSSLH